MTTKVNCQKPTTPRAKIAFVGEAPGDTEELTGVPLSGPSGKILDQALKALDIKRSECLITNVFDFKLPKNDIAKIAKSRATVSPRVKRSAFLDWDDLPVASGKYVEPDLIDESLSRLQAELASVNPQVIVPLGGTAVWAVCQMQGHGMIKKVRGAKLVSKLFTIPAVPAFHPAFILRSYHLFSVFLMDLFKAKRIAEGDPGEFRHTILQLDSPSEISSMLSLLTTPVAVDIETVKNSLIDCIGFADEVRGFTVPLFDDRSFAPAWSFSDEVLARRAVTDFLMSNTPKVFQNGCYDVQMLWECWRVPVKGWVADTRIMHKILFPELPADLASMAALHTWAGGWKAEYHASRDKRGG